MKSIKFPNMFNTNSTNTYKASEYRQASLQNTKLLLAVERGTLICDPYFGLPIIENFMFGQNSYIMREAFIDMIYTQLAIFVPQIRVERGDIKLIQDREKGKIYCSFTGVNQIDFKVETQTLVLENVSNTAN